MRKFIIDGVECKVAKATIGLDGFEASELLKKYNKIFIDEGFVNTASCRSKITYIDGDAGVLVHRGYKIEDILTNKTFMETMYMILNEDFAVNESEQGNFENEFHGVDIDIDGMLKIANIVEKNSHPMSILLAIFSGVTTSASTKKFPSNKEKALYAIKSMLYAVAICICKITGKEFTPDFSKLSYSQLFANMVMSSEISGDKSAIECFDKILSLHIDHGQNASTSTMRMICSTGCDLFGGICGAISSLWGVLHGGANEAVLKMIDSIGSVDNVAPFIENVKNKVDGIRLMGFGHRIYKNYDPRAKVLKGYADYVMHDMKLDVESDFRGSVANEIERIALADEYFASRKLFPNVDFYSGIIYSKLGIPANAFTCIFALSRVVGWCSQWMEAVSGENKLQRPDQVYIGEKIRVIKK